MPPFQENIFLAGAKKGIQLAKISDDLFLLIHQKDEKFYVTNCAAPSAAPFGLCRP